MSMRNPPKPSDPARPVAEGAGRCYFLGADRRAAPPLEPGLYIVATPIGNLGDITLRALETLAAADFVACEDTRVTRVLMDRYGLKTPLHAYHDHNADAVRPRLLAALAEGKVVALVSDAGTPLISDPGYKLVAAAAEAGHRVIPIPGASALLAGLVTAGLPTDSFLFAGFLSAREEARRRRIEELAPLPSTIVLYESPHRLAETLAELSAVMGPDRPAVVARELTKAFEQVVRGRLADLAARYATDKPKGEIVILIGPAAEAETSDVDVDRLLMAALARAAPGKAAAEVARLTGRNRKDLYERALALKPEAPAQPSERPHSGRSRR